MSALGSCPGCPGFVPTAATACPHCDAPQARPAGPAARLRRLAGSAACALTLMACYGAPPPVHGPAGGCGPGGADADGDGFCTPHDCDDGRADVGPTRADPPGDGVDLDCDGADAAPAAP